MKIFFIGIITVLVIVLAGVILLPKPDGASAPSGPDIIAARGIHWHPKLEIFVGGERVEIPHNVGLGTVHQPIHTHEDLPLIHLEFPALVRTQDVRLGRFFEIWGRDMRRFGENMRMNVNGTENTDYERYIMRDGDVIELRYD